MANKYLDLGKRLTGGLEKGSETVKRIVPKKEDLTLNPAEHLERSGQIFRDLSVPDPVRDDLKHAAKEIGHYPVEARKKAGKWWTQNITRPAGQVRDGIVGAVGGIRDWANGTGGPEPFGGAGIPGGGVVAPTMPGGGPFAGYQPGNLSGTDPRAALIQAPELFRNYQSNLATQLAARARGEGPSLADMQFRQAQQANQAAYFSQLASARGNNPLNARTAAMASQATQAQTARDAAMARVAEQQKAQELLGTTSQQGRQQDLVQAQINQKDANDRAVLAQQFQELQAKYAQMGLDAAKANQLAAIDVERLKMQMQAARDMRYGNLFNAAGSMVSGVASIFTGGGGNGGAGGGAGGAGGGGLG